MTTNTMTKMMLTTVDSSGPSNDPVEATLLPRLEHGEVRTGKLLGRGGYSHVFELKEIHLNRINDNDKQRRVLAKCGNKNTAFCTRHSQYVIKTMAPNLAMESPKKFQTGLEDLKREGRMLASLQHPNIISVRAQSRSADSSFFLVLDRLSQTLDDRIKTYKGQSERRRKASFGKRMHIASDIAGAVAYLHQKGVVHRDIKPANIGFDRRGNVQLFDFGVARKLPTEKHHEDSLDECFLQGRVGTLRYMSPEVFLGKRYNAKADVFSLSLVVWELLVLISKAFEGLSSQEHVSLVMKEGTRPPLPSNSWPREVYDLLQSAWHADPCKRPTAKAFQNVLVEQKMIARQPRLQNGMVLRRNSQRTKWSQYRCLSLGA